MAGRKLRSIRNFVFRYARPLDVARWNYHFEDGSAKEVLKALAAYKNFDGGFGHGIEPDFQNPNSTPTGTWAAVRILRELDFPEEAGNLMADIHRYLLNNGEFDGTYWPGTVRSNNDWPHAPWWSHSERAEANYNPTAELAGFLVRTAKPGSPAHAAGEEIIRSIPERLGDRVPEVHELANFTAMLEDLAAAGRQAILPDDFSQTIARQVHAAIEQNPDRYDTDAYRTEPKFYIRGKSSPYFDANREICEFYAGWLEKTVGEDGAWEPNWAWGEQEMPPDARRDWKGILIVDNMLFLQGMKPDLTTVG